MKKKNIATWSDSEERGGQGHDRREELRDRGMGQDTGGRVRRIHGLGTQQEGEKAVEVRTERDKLKKKEGNGGWQDRKGQGTWTSERKRKGGR